MVPLLIKSEYSMLESLVRLESLVEMAKQRGYSALAITDSNLHGSYKFIQACQTAGVQPIIGFETLWQQQPIVIYPKTNPGYQALLRFVSFPDEATTKHPDWLFVSRGHNVPLVFDELDYLGLELNTLDQEVQVAPKIATLSSTTGRPLLLLSEVRYLNPGDAVVLDVLSAIKEGKPTSIASSSDGPHYLRTQDQLKAMSAEYPIAYENIQAFIDLIQVNYESRGFLLPRFAIDHEPAEYLKALAIKGLQKRLGQQPSKAYEERLLYELVMLEQMGFVDYMLIVYDFVRYAKSQDIYVGPGRGSVAGSLVAYVLGITNTDPLRFELLFERFLNPERITMPDIDLDFPDDKRELLLLYAKEKYGEEHVASIVTFGTFAARSAIRDVAKVLSLPQSFVNELFKYVPAQGASLVALQEDKKVRALIERYPEMRQLFEFAVAIEGLPRHSSTHAAGIILSSEPIIQYTALQTSTGPLLQTQWEAKDLESFGLLKIDFLGLSNLKILKRTVEQIERVEGTSINLYQLEFDDPLAYQLLRNKQTDGVFQLESRGIRQVLHDMNVSNFEDIVATLALYRPGPMEFIPDYIKRKDGRAITYPHASIEDILAPTYGIIVYQEQIMRIANVFAGYSLAQADLLRRAVSKKDKELMQIERSRFIELSQTKGRTKTEAEAIFDLIDRFANYGFNRSHSVAYAMIAYQCAYLKAHYPKHFLSVLLSHHVGSSEHTKLYVDELRRTGVRVLAPNINQSTTEYVVQGNEVLMPFVVIKGISTTMAQKLLEARGNQPFASPADFANRTKGFLNKTHWQGLIDSGALDVLQVTRYAWTTQWEDFLKFLDYGSLMDDAQFDFVTKEYSSDELMQKEKASLGMAIAHDPFVPYQSLIQERGLSSLSDVTNKTIKHVLVRIAHVKTITTKTQKSMAFVKIESDTMNIEAIAFPEIYAAHASHLQVGAMCILGLSQQTNQQKESMIIESVEELS
jgi:DNA polymerase III subunit alpha